MTEKVLVLPVAAVPGGTAFTGVRPLAEGEITGLREAIRTAGVWMDRDRAEADPAHKQLIPYVVVRDGGRAFLMERSDAGADVRLHRRATIGVGGHVNPEDDGVDPLGTGLAREWAEEIDADWTPHFAPIGMLNDDRNAVGAVHLGIVFEVQTGGRPLTVRERAKLSGHMADQDEIRTAWDRLETWSQLVAAALWGDPEA
jgi:predicted NUDIX family phosphoesterase